MDEDERLPDEAAPEVMDEAVADAGNQETEQPEVVETPESEESDEAETPDSPPEEDEEQKSESRKRRERRKEHIAQLQQQKEEAEARLDRIKSAITADEEPKEEDFDDHMEWVAARAAWLTQTKTVQHQVSVADKEIEALEERRVKELDAAWAAQMEDARSRMQDFDRVALNQDLPVSGAMVEAIKQSDNGADMLYSLGSRPAEAARIASLSPVEQVFALGRLSASLQAPKPKVKSNAPPPISPVSGQSKVDKDPSRMSSDEYREWRRNGGGR